MNDEDGDEFLPADIQQYKAGDTIRMKWTCGECGQRNDSPAAADLYFCRKCKEPWRFTMKGSQ